MKYYDLSTALSQFKKLQRISAAYDHAIGVLYLDATTAAPKDTWEGRGKTMEIMSQLTHDLTADPGNEELYAYLQDHSEALDQQTLRELEVMKKNYDRMK